MVKLNRFTMPVFAGNAAQTQTSVFGTMKTSPQYTTDVAASIGTTAYGNGWADAIEIGYAPYMEDMNTLQRAITYQISYNQQQGIPEWDSSTEYYIGSLAKLNTANGSQVYSSLIDNNVGNLVSDTTKWKLVLDTANGYVTTNTAQTITGVKTFTSKIYTAPIELYPVSGSDKDYIDFHFGGDTSDYTARIIENTSGNLTIDATSFLVPTPSDTTSTSSQQAATVGWANTIGNNLVHKSGAETIAGVKTFTSTINGNAATVTNGVYTNTDQTITGTKTIMTAKLHIKNDSIVTGTAPSSTQVNSVQFVDSNDRVMGWVYSSYNAQKEAAVRLQAMKSNAAGDTEYSSIGVAYPATGNPYGFAPSSDENGSILTTVAKNKAANGYFKLGNGMIVQWGRTTDTVNQTKTITFPVAFTSTNYSITVAANNQSSGYSYDGVTGISDRTTTSCKVYSYYANRTYDWIAIGY